MSHYICTGGCGGVSDKPGACQAETCAKHGVSLDVCDCKELAHEEGEAKEEGGGEEKYQESTSS